MADFIQNGGTNGGSYASHFSGILSVWENSYDVVTNTSNVGYRLQLKSGSSGRFSGLTANYSVTINGNVVKSGSGTYSSQNYNVAQTICEGTITVTHNADGTMNLNCSAVLDFQSHTYSPGDFTPNGTLSLTTIPRASTAVCTTANIEEIATIIINRASSNFKHTLIWHFGDLQGTIIEKTSDTVIGWTIPSNLYTQIPNAQIGIGVLECITYNGNAEIGRNTSNFYATTSENRCKPSLSAAVVDINQNTINLTGSNAKLIKYKSTAKITIITNAKNSASISSKKVNNSLVEESSISISNVETDTFIVTVTDSRGYTNSVTLKPTVVNYVPLSINVTVKRVQPTSGEVAVGFTGNYFNGNFGNIANTLSMSWYYKEIGTEQWILGGNITPTISNNTFSNGNSKISLGTIFNYKKSYMFYIRTEDKLTRLQPISSVPSGKSIFNWGKDFFNINEELLVNNEPIKGKVLYQNGNENGTSEDITISENIADFSYLEIFYAFYTSNVPYFSSCKIENPSNKKVSLFAVSIPENSPFLIGVANINISTNTISWLRNNTYFSNNTLNTVSINEVKIYKIIGYK